MGEGASPNGSRKRGTATHLRTWGRLLRVPNLFTVPGDPVAGYLLASGGLLGWDALGAVGASLCLYAAGLLLNDYFDREVDARERPERPIPSGAVRAGTVLAVGLAALFAGVLVAWLVGGRTPGLVAALLAIAVVAYDAWLKRVRWLGPVVMGSCRGGSVLVGAAFAGHLGAAPALTVGGITGLYITAVTVIAAGEMGDVRPGVWVFCPAVVLLAGLVVMLVAWPPEVPLLVLLLFVAGGPGVGVAAHAAGRVWRGTMAVPPFIGVLLRATIPVQAAWAAWRCSYPGVLAWILVLGGVALLACAELAGRRFAGS